MKNCVDKTIAEKFVKEARLREMISSMMSKYCAINKSNCRVDCVHFDCGKVFGDGEEYRIKKPSCKLWK